MRELKLQKEIDRYELYIELIKTFFLIYYYYYRMIFEQALQITVNNHK